MEFKFFVLFLSIIFSIFYAMSEVVLTSTSLLGEKLANKKIVKLWKKNPDKILSAIVVGNNFAHISFALILTSIAIDISKQFNLSINLSVSISSLLGIIFILFFCEILPKIYGRVHFEKIINNLDEFIFIFAQLFQPIAAVFSKLFQTIFFQFKKPSIAPYLSKDELLHILTSETKTRTYIHRKKLISNILRFADLKVGEITIPRTNIFAVDISDTQENIIKQIISHKFSRVPVYKDSLDNIIGVIYTKDLITTWRFSQLIILQDLIRQPFFVTETTKVSQLLKDLKSGKHHLAIVLDEFGGTEGIVTIEDIVEEIIGNIDDEFDEPKQTIQKIDENVWIIDVTENLSFINQETGLNLPKDDFYNLGQFVLEIFGKIPKINEKIIWNSYKITIHDAEKNRIKKVKVENIPST